jgi:hypothetical protein
LSIFVGYSFPMALLSAFCKLEKFILQWELKTNVLNYILVYRSFKRDRIWILGICTCHACCCYVWISVVYDSDPFAGILYAFSIHFLILLYISYIHVYLRIHMQRHSHHYFFLLSLTEHSCFIFLGWNAIFFLLCELKTKLKRKNPMVSISHNPMQ